MQMRKKKGSDQPRRLIIDFVFRYLDSRISLPLYQPLAGIYLKVNYEDRFMLRVCFLLKPVSHQPCGSRAPVRVDKFLDFVRQPHGVVYYTARLSYEKQGRKAAATNFRHVHFLCDLLAFSERCTKAARHTRLPQGCRKTAARHARCSYD